MPDRRSRDEAMAAGLTRYFTGCACKRGHVVERMVSTRACTECLAQHAAAWRAANPERLAAQKRAWVAANPERAKALKSANQKRNRASANERNRRYREANLDRTRSASEAWRLANPGLAAAKQAKRRARLLERTPPWADIDATAGMYELAQAFRRTGMEIEVDHAIPLQGKRVSGLHVADNLQLINASMNKSKSNRFAV